MRVADSASMRQTSRVTSTNSSFASVDSWGSPRCRRSLRLRARAKRPFETMITRSVMSLSTGLDAFANEPHAQDPDDVDAFSQITSPRISKPRSSCKMVMTSALRLRYGLRPRLATFTAIRPPGSSTRTHSANTDRSMSRNSRYVPGIRESGSSSPFTASSYSLPTKYGGDVTTSATLLSGSCCIWVLEPWNNRPRCNSASSSSVRFTSSSSDRTGGVNRS